METQNLTAARREALLSLLDDPNPGVHRALLAHFRQLGPDIAPFLQSVARSPDPALAHHAACFLNELRFTDPVAEFRSFIRSLHYELETGALLLARTVTARLDVGACCAALDVIATRCRELIVEPSTPREQCRIINRVLFHEWGFHANVAHYTDPRNSLLDQVLARRSGIPISLSIVYLLIAGRLGLELEPVGLPGHFIVGCFSENRPFFIDPFDRGVFHDPEEIYEALRASHLVPKPSDLAPTPIREVLCRCCRNLVIHYTAASDTAHANLFAGFVAEFEATHERNST